MGDVQVIGAAPGQAGPRVQLEGGRAQAPPADIGTTGYVGPLRWGPSNTLPVVHSDRAHFVRFRGGAMPEDPTPEAVQDHYSEAGDRAPVVTLRLAGADAAKAKLTAYARDVAATQVYKTAYPNPTELLTLEGTYLGKRGGRRAYLTGTGAAGFDAGAGAFDTSATLIEDQWIGATLTFESHTTTYKVTGNDTAGVLTIEVNPGDAGPGSGAKWWLRLVNANFDDASDGFAAQWGSGARKPGTEFSLNLAVDGSVKSGIQEPNLSVGSADVTFIDEVLRKALVAQRQMLVLSTLEGTPVPDTQQRPANWVGLVAPAVPGAAVLTNTVSVRTEFWASTQGTSDAYQQPLGSAAYGAETIRHKAVITFTDGAGAFTVEYRLWDDTVISEATLVAGVAGTQYDPAVPFLASFMVRETTAVLDDEITLWFSPLPSGLRNLTGWLYAHAYEQDPSDDLRKRYRIVGNTATSITLRSGTTLDATDSVVAPAYAVGVAPTTGPYDLTGGGLTFIYEVNTTEGNVTLTSSLSGAAETAAALAADLNVQEAAAHTGEPQLLFEDDGNGTLRWRTIESWGSGASVIARAAGTLPLGIGGDQTDTGVDGTVVAVGYLQDMHGGLDGVASLSTEYEDSAFDPVDSPLNQLDEFNLGLIKFTTPGQSDPTLRNTAEAYTHGHGWIYIPEIAPAQADNVDAAVAHVTGTFTPLGSTAPVYDTYGVRRRPLVPGRVAPFTMVGSVLGMEARIARESKGFHVAPSGEKATIDVGFSQLASSTDGDPVESKDDSKTNPVGIRAVQHQGGRIFVFGDQMPAENNRGTLWYHKRCSTLHIARELLFMARPHTYDPLDETLTALLVLVAKQTILRPKWDAGWFRPVRGKGFDDQIEVRADADLNTPAVQETGRLILVVRTPPIVDTAKNIEFILGTGGVAVVDV